MHPPPYKNPEMDGMEWRDFLHRMQAESALFSDTGRSVMPGFKGGTSSTVLFETDPMPATLNVLIHWGDRYDVSPTTGTTRLFAGSRELFSIAGLQNRGCWVAEVKQGERIRLTYSEAVMRDMHYSVEPL